MKPDLVVDVGNSLIKWGLCSAARVEKTTSLPSGDPQTWQQQLLQWNITTKKTWIVTGVAPKKRAVLMDWLGDQGQTVCLLEDPGQLPLQVRLERPDHVGIDRLVSAVAANTRRPAGSPAIIVDAGSAVTVDWLDEEGAFAGGAIFPGIRLMTRALHSYTALLPEIDIKKSCPTLPGLSTPGAMEAGVFWAVAGGINTLIAHLAGNREIPVFLTGGDTNLLLPALEGKVTAWPEMTLEGIRLSVSSL